MSDPALETLIYGLNETGFLNGLGDDARILFINARVHNNLPRGMQCVQWFKPYAQASEERDFQNTPRIENVDAAFDHAFLLFPKNIIEGRYLIARALQLLKDGGSLFVVAENKAGGTRLQKIVQQFGGEIVQQISKNKSRFVQIENTDIDKDFVRECIDAGSMKTIDGNGFSAQAGIYGWDKIDKGSQILLQHSSLKS